MTLIKTQKLSFGYSDNGSLALSNIDFSLNEGEWVAVLGANGSGKSTFARQLNAILQPTNGVVWVDGIDTSNDELIFEVRRRVGMVFQNPDNQLVASIVEEDVAFAPENLGLQREEIRSRVNDALDAVDMSDKSKSFSHSLSGGQKQRVAIAGVLAMRPRCIVLDEATAMLDPQGRRETLKAVKKLQKKYNTAVVWITHFMDEATASDRAIVFSNGRIITQGSLQEVFSDIELLQNAGLELPPAIALSKWLISKGYIPEQPIFTPEECAMAIKKRLEESSCL